MLTWWLESDESPETSSPAFLWNKNWEKTWWWFSDVFFGSFPLLPSLPVGCGSLRGAAQSAVWLREPHRPAHCAGASRGHEPHLDHAQSKAGEKRDETGRVSIAGSPFVCLKMGSNGGDPDIDHWIIGDLNGKMMNHDSNHKTLIISNYAFKWFEPWFEPWFNDPFFLGSQF